MSAEHAAKGIGKFDDGVRRTAGKQRRADSALALSEHSARRFAGKLLCIVFLEQKVRKIGKHQKEHAFIGTAGFEHANGLRRASGASGKGHHDVLGKSKPVVSGAICLCRNAGK